MVVDLRLDWPSCTVTHAWSKCKCIEDVVKKRDDSKSSSSFSACHGKVPNPWAIMYKFKIEAKGKCNSLCTDLHPFEIFVPISRSCHDRSSNNPISPTQPHSNQLKTRIFNNQLGTSSSTLQSKSIWPSCMCFVHLPVEARNSKCNDHTYISCSRSKSKHSGSYCKVSFCCKLNIKLGIMMYVPARWCVGHGMSKSNKHCPNL